jgi:DNA-binding response OmpR family regulator
MNGTVLLVEDDARVNAGNTAVLAAEGIQAVAAQRLHDARQVLEEQAVDAIILDIVMPDGNGVDFLPHLQEYSAAPVLFLTGKHEREDMIAGLQAGGIDYITKPYDIDIFAAKVKSLIGATRHYKREYPSMFLECGPVRLDTSKDLAFVHGKQITLTQKEFSLLACFIAELDRVFTLKELHRYIWSDKYLPSDLSLIRKHISNVRTKLESAGSEYTIRSVYRKGYYFGHVDSDADPEEEDE